MCPVKEQKTKHSNLSHIEIQRYYSPDDLEGMNLLQELGKPGEYPFTRGIYPTMYRGKLWTIRQYAGFGTAEQSNKRYKFLLSQGQTGMSVAFDLPTQLGLDSDHPMSLGEVGKVGVAIDSIEDMEVLFDGIPLDQVSVSMTINASAAIILAMYLALAEQKGISWDKLTGTTQNDVLKEYIARGTYIFPPKPSLKIITDIFSFCQKKVPSWNTISISGYHIREAGATAVQELAFTFSDAIAYVESALSAGLNIDSFAPRLSFFLAAHNDFFEEISKFRAARRLWAEIMKERFHAKNPQSLKFRFHTQTSGVTLTAKEPENNVIRVALQALAAVLGGTQSLHTNSRDEALSLPTQQSVQIALRTQQLLAYESGVTHTVDPAGGSYYIEKLTFQIADLVREYINKIDSMGGMQEAIDNGYIQKDIQDSAYAYHQLIENNENIIVGVNAFSKQDNTVNLEIHTSLPELENKQINKLHALKRRRNKELVHTCLDSLRKGLINQANIMPLLIEAVKAKVTLGEICSVMKEVYGTYQETITI